MHLDISTYLPYLMLPVFVIINIIFIISHELQSPLDSLWNISSQKDLDSFGIFIYWSLCFL